MVIPRQVATATCLGSVLSVAMETQTANPLGRGNSKGMCKVFLGNRHLPRYTQIPKKNSGNVYSVVRSREVYKTKFSVVLRNAMH
jgi:hypothetical protein